MGKCQRLHEESFIYMNFVHRKCISQITKLMDDLIDLPETLVDFCNGNRPVVE